MGPLSRGVSLRSMTEPESVQREPPRVMLTIAAMSSAHAEGMRAVACGASSLEKPQKFTPVYHASIAPKMGTTLMKEKRASATTSMYCTGQNAWYSMVMWPPLASDIMKHAPMRLAHSAHTPNETRRSTRRSCPKAWARTPPLYSPCVSGVAALRTPKSKMPDVSHQNQPSKSGSSNAITRQPPPTVSMRRGASSARGEGAKRAMARPRLNRYPRKPSSTPCSARVSSSSMGSARIEPNSALESVVLNVITKVKSTPCCTTAAAIASLSPKSYSSSSVAPGRGRAPHREAAISPLI